MKKIIALMLAVIMLSTLMSACAPKGTTGETATSSTTEAIVSNVRYSDEKPYNDIPTDIEGEPLVKIFMLSWDGQRLETQYIRGSAARQIEEMLAGAGKTGETEAKFSDFEGDITYENFRMLYETEISCGTVWIEAGGKLYRKEYDIDEEKSKFCLVQSYLGEGEVLDIGKDELDAYNKIRAYWPKDSYSGTYENGELTVKHIYAGESLVDIKVIRFEENRNSSKGKVILEITSSEDAEVNVKLHAEISDDNLLGGDNEKLALRAGEAQTAELGFTIPSPYWNYSIEITADNTVVYIRAKYR